ncbi:MAG TPA: hypothetical protein PLO45_09360 [Defluviitoga sp.]|nr:hypothetical protein [Defluviitoga sp.]
MKNLSRTIVSLIVLIIASLTFSQGFFSEEFGGIGGVDIGAKWMDVSELNKMLKKNKLPELSGPAFLAGGGGYALLGKVLYGGEGYGIYMLEKADEYTLKLDVGYGLFDIGYLIYAKQALRIYGIGGVGFGGMKFNISKDPTSKKFDDLLTNYWENSFESGVIPIFKIGAGADYILAPKGSSSTGGLAIGISAGYVFAPFDPIGGWELSDTSVSNVPKFGPTGPYITIKIGGGAFVF